MTAATIRQKLCDYIQVAEEKKIKAIYTMLEDEIEEVHDYWNDKSFMEELDKRTAEFKNGKVSGLTWDEAKTKILASGKKEK